MVEIYRPKEHCKIIFLLRQSFCSRVSIGFVIHSKSTCPCSVWMKQRSRVLCFDLLVLRLIQIWITDFAFKVHLCELIKPQSSVRGIHLSLFIYVMYNKASSQKPSCVQHPSHTQKKHHLDLLKVRVGSHIVSAVSRFQKLGLWVGVGGRSM